MYRIILVPFLLFLNIFSLLCEDWYSLRGNKEGTASIKYNFNTEIREWHYTYRSNRRYKSGIAVWASPAITVINGHPMVFIGGYDQTMHALNLIEKKVIWRKISNGEIKTAPVIYKVMGVDVVFWGSSDRTLYANIAYNGEQFWTRELVPPSNSLGEVTLSSPFILNNKLYISSFAYDKSLSRNQQKGILYCIDIYNGDILWYYQITSGPLSSPVGFTFKDKNFITCVAKRGLIQCFDVTENVLKKVWEYQMPHEVIGSPVITEINEKLYLFIGSKYGNFIAINAITGKKIWQKMAGNWIDNTASIGMVSGKKIVFVGSHDYRVYAFDCINGKTLWNRSIGGEIYSAPVFFHINNDPFIAITALDNHLYILDANKGKVITSFFVGNPIWDKITKGENLWSSPVVIEAGENTVVVHGSYNNKVYVIPILKDSSLKAMARSSKSLWLSLLFVFVVFLFIILPVIILLPKKNKIDILEHK